MVAKKYASGLVKASTSHHQSPEPPAPPQQCGEPWWPSGRARASAPGHGGSHPVPGQWLPSGSLDTACWMLGIPTIGDHLIANESELCSNCIKSTRIPITTSQLVTFVHLQLIEIRAIAAVSNWFLHFTILLRPPAIRPTDCGDDHSFLVHGRSLFDKPDYFWW